MTQIVIRRRTPRLGSWAAVAAAVGLVTAFAWAIPTPAHSLDSSWRRTSHGWKQLDCRAFGLASRNPSLHPLCVAAFQTLLAAMLLISSNEVHRRREAAVPAEPARCAGPVPASFAFSGRGSSALRAGRSTNSYGPPHRAHYESFWTGREKATCRRPKWLP